jgi:5-(carboxyamino)imidazole ribonucleotide synthase
MTGNLTPLPAGAWLGLLGGGQLGRMFCMAAQSMGFRVCVLDPAPDSPACAVADAALCADYLDEQALDALAARCVAVTTEFENVPAQALQRLAQRVRVSPSAAAVAVMQDRIAEKAFLQRSGVAVAPYAVLQSEADLPSLPKPLWPGILKAARLGYDGKGQVALAAAGQTLAAFRALGGVPCVLEQRLSLAREISVLVARGWQGQTEVWPVAENVHRDGILLVSRVAAEPVDAIGQHAQRIAIELAAALDYVGVLCVEFFVLADGRLFVNEMAPRPHNSGHYTLDAAVTSQFEQQVRALAGWPLGSTRLLGSSVMLNLLGDIWWRAGQSIEPDWSAVLRHPGASLHLYGKTHAKPGRKMGHVTVVRETLAECETSVADIARQLQIAPYAGGGGAR